MRRYVVWTGTMVAIWVLLWDRLTLANVAGGLVVAGVLLVVFPLAKVAEGSRLRFNPVAQVKLVLTILFDLVVSNWTMARLILARRPDVQPRVVACTMAVRNPALLSIIAIIVALSPGMMVIEHTADEELLVHALNTTDAGVRRRIARLERMVVSAFGSIEDRLRCGVTAR